MTSDTTRMTKSDGSGKSAKCARCGRCCCCCGAPDGTDGGGSVVRPGRPTGDDCGRLSNAKPLSVADLHRDNPPNCWGGPRKWLYLPFLFMRENPGDMGTRLNPDGTRKPDVFWESPDILIVPGVEPADAPAVPKELGYTALANQPNTVYAHVWNFGRALAAEVVVDFGWCDPSLGLTPDNIQPFNDPKKPNLRSQAFTTLGARGSSWSHALVKCPVAWYPTFRNGGHECLLVRAWEYSSDPLGAPPWDASINRHVAQRNIHVEASAAGELRRNALGRGDAVGNPRLQRPIELSVGPLFGSPAQVSVARVAPGQMPWLQLRTGVRGKYPAPAAATGAPTLSLPFAAGGSISTAGHSATQTVAGDNQKIHFYTSDQQPAPGQAHIYRVSASQAGQLFGGYTVVLLG